MNAVNFAVPADVSILTNYDLVKHPDCRHPFILMALPDNKKDDGELIYTDRFIAFPVVPVKDRKYLTKFDVITDLGVIEVWNFIRVQTPELLKILSESTYTVKVEDPDIERNVDCVFSFMLYQDLPENVDELFPHQDPEYIAISPLFDMSILTGGMPLDGPHVKDRYDAIRSIGW
jgi:hypothetical protein